MGGVLNLSSYVTDTHYVYEAEYRSDNEVLAQYIEDNYSNSIITIPNSAVRGYVNLLFERGIYEWKSADTLIAKAEETGKRYVIELIVDNSESGNVYKFGGARIYDLEADMNWGIVINNGGNINDGE